MKLEDISSEDSLKTIAESAFYLGIDPGESNGIAGYNAFYDLIWMLTVKERDFKRFLSMCKHVKIVILEDYRLYPNKAMKQVYSDMLTSRVIGRTEVICALQGIKLIKQPASIKTTGYKWLGKKPLPKSNPANHELDAHVHFMYWAIQTGKINAASLLS